MNRSFARLFLFLFVSACASHPPAFIVEGDYEASKHGIARFYAGSDESADEAKRLIAKFCMPQAYRITQSHFDLASIVSESGATKDDQPTRTVFTTVTHPSNIYLSFRCEGSAPTKTEPK